MQSKKKIKFSEIEIDSNPNFNTLEQGINNVTKDVAVLTNEVSWIRKKCSELEQQLSIVNKRTWWILGSVIMGFIIMIAAKVVFS